MSSPVQKQDDRKDNRLSRTRKALELIGRTGREEWCSSADDEEGEAAGQPLPLLSRSHLALLSAAIHDDILERVAAHLLDLRQSVDEAKDATKQLLEKSFVKEMLCMWEQIGGLNQRVANLEAKKE